MNPARFGDSSPSFDDFPARKTPHNEAMKFDLLSRSRVSGSPGISYHPLIPLSDYTLNCHMQVGPLLMGRFHHDHCRLGTYLRPRRFVMVQKVSAKVHKGDLRLLPIHKVLKVIHNEFLHLLQAKAWIAFWGYG